jgi:hypothetical protein
VGQGNHAEEPALACVVLGPADEDAGVGEYAQIADVVFVQVREHHRVDVAVPLVRILRRRA